MNLRQFNRLGVVLAWISGAGVAFGNVTPDEATMAEETPGGTDNEVTLIDTSGNPYRAIVARNAFRLKDPLPPPPPPTNALPPPEQPKVDVKLAGLAEIRGARFAYLMVPDLGRPGQFEYPTLTDDPVHGRVRHGNGLEVREINLKEQTVRLVNGGIEATINFKDNGVKAVAAASPPKPGAPNVIRPGAPAAITPGVVTTAGGVPAAASEPIVFSRNPNRASGGANANTGGSPSMLGGIPMSVLAPPSGGDVVVPSRPVRTSGAGGTPVQDAPAPQVSLEQQYEALMRQRQAADQSGIQLPPIPGLPLPTDPNP